MFDWCGRLIPIATISFILCSIGSAYSQNLTNSTSATTDNFLTFSNSACGITLKYPPDWNNVELSDTYRSKSDSNSIAYLTPPKNLVIQDQTNKSDFSIMSIDVKDAYSTKTLRGYTIRNLDSYKTLPKFSLVESNSTYMGNILGSITIR
jgi:hypothetical protein